MSPSPFSETRIGLFSTACGAVKMSGVFRRATNDARIAHWDSEQSGALVPEQCLVHLRSLDLARQAITLILGAPYNRYLVLAGAEALKTDTDWYAYARTRAAQVYGGSPESWQVTLSAEIEGVRIGAVTETVRLDAICAALSAPGAKVKRVVPYLSIAFERVRRQVPEAARCWLALAEPGHLTSIAADHARIVRIVQRQIRSEPLAAIKQSLRQEEIRLGWEPNTTRILWQAGSEVIETEGLNEDFELPARVAETFAPPPARRDVLIAAMLH